MAEVVSLFQAGLADCAAIGFVGADSVTLPVTPADRLGRRSATMKFWLGMSAGSQRDSLVRDSIGSCET